MAAQKAVSDLLLTRVCVCGITWLSKSSDPLDMGSRSPERAYTDPEQVIAAMAEAVLP